MHESRWHDWDLLGLGSRTRDCHPSLWPLRLLQIFGCHPRHQGARLYWELKPIESQGQAEGAILNPSASTDHRPAHHARFATCVPCPRPPFPPHDFLQRSVSVKEPIEQDTVTKIATSCRSDEDGFPSVHWGFDDAQLARLEDRIRLHLRQSRSASRVSRGGE